MTPSRRVGTWEVSPIGYGAMQLSDGDRPEEDAATSTLIAALDAGCNLIDTADAYCLGPDEIGHNERLIARTLRQWGGDPSSVLVATKGGHTRRPDGSWDLDGRPDHLRRACEASLAALGVDAIGLYQFHRPDPGVPFEDSVGALAELQHEGKVRMVGLSNVDVAQLEQARQIVDVASVQNQFSPWFTSSRGELEACADAGIAFLCWAPLGGRGRVTRAAELLPEFAAVADAHGASTHRVVLAWQLAQAAVVVPIPGARRIETTLDALAAAELSLEPEELRRLDASLTGLTT